MGETVISLKSERDAVSLPPQRPTDRGDIHAHAQLARADFIRRCIFGERERGKTEMFHTQYSYSSITGNFTKCFTHSRHQAELEI